MAEASCRKVVKHYDGGVQAVKGIDLEIAGLEEITDGEIWIGGDIVNDVPPHP